MKRKVYEHVLEMNQGYDRVLRSLKALAKHPSLQRGEIRRFEQLAREGRAATNSLTQVINCTLSRDRRGSIPHHPSFSSTLRCGVRTGDAADRLG